MNSNGPLQVGGLYFGHDRISALAKGKCLGLNSLTDPDHVTLFAGLDVDPLKLPDGVGFAGCMKNLTVVQGNK